MAVAPEPEPAPLPRRDAPLAAIIYKICATIAFAAMAAVIKLTHGKYPVGEVIFFRAAFALPVVVIWALAMGQMRDAWTTNNVWFHVSRSTVGLAAMFLSFVALTELPLTDWTVIGFAMPIFATILAAALLGEPVGRWRGSAVVIGFLGVLIAIGPKLNLAHGVPALIMLASTLCSGLVIVIIRKISASENGSAIAFYFMLACTVVSACTLPFAWVTPSMGDLLLLVAAGVCGGLGQVCNTFSYARGQPSMLGPFDYLGLIWAAGFDVALFSVWPDLTIWLGAAIIVASGLVIAWREHYRGQQKARIQSV